MGVVAESLMNYAKHYQTLMDRAECRVLTGYSERHHVVPRCIDKASKRTVRLTPEEHYVAHQLLVKMHPDNTRLLWAAVNMTGNAPTKHSRRNKLYGWLRRELSERMKGNTYGVGVVQSAERRRQQSIATKGRPGISGYKHTEETKARMREFLNSPEFVAKNRAKSLGLVTPPEVRGKQSATNTATWADPELRARHSIIVKEAWARRKAAKLAVESAA